MERKKFLNAAGSLLLLSGVLYGMVRFADEFLRAKHHTVLYGLNTVQWMLLIISCVTTFVIIFNERKKTVLVTSPVQRSFGRAIGLFMVLGFLYSLSWAVVDTLEVISLYPVIVLSLVLLVYGLFTIVTISSLRWSSAGVLLLGLIMMSQVAPEKEEKSEEQRHYYTVAIGLLTGYHTYLDERSSTDCDGNRSYTLAKFRESYNMGSLGIAKSVVKGDRTLTYGLNGQLGMLEEKGEENVRSSRSLFAYAVNPFVRYDMRFIGFGGGFHVGDLPVINSSFETDRATLIRRHRFYPQVYLRGGELRSFFGEVMFADGIGGTFPASTFQMTAGYGFNKTNGTALRIGVTSRAAFFISPTLAAGHRLLFQPYVGFGPSAFTDFSDEKNFQGAMRISYRFE